MTYQVVPHLADFRLKLSADSLPELFLAGLKGMDTLLKSNLPYHEIGDLPITKRLELASLDISSLLIDFLSTILTLSYENKAIFCKVEFEEFKENLLKATVYGKVIDKFDKDIKAVTYHEVEIQKNNEGKYETLVVFDI